MSLEHLPIFVYGTLKRGEKRAHCWPCPPRKVEPATTHAQMLDLGAYPAIVPGHDRISGELWYLERGDLEMTLRKLDEIECFGVDEVDLYVRRVVTCQTAAGEWVCAYAYFLADRASAANASVVKPDDSGREWGQTWVFGFLVNPKNQV